MKEYLENCRDGGWIVNVFCSDESFNVTQGQIAWVDDTVFMICVQNWEWVIKIEDVIAVSREVE